LNTNVEKGASTSLDWLKWLAVTALVGGGIYGNWYFQAESLLLRVVVLLLLAAVAVFVAIRTETGRSAWNLIRDSRGELRRVVWPARQETTQTTIVVLILIVIFALILWGLDSLLGWVISAIIG
jgi:preprotein translocase subunit SecE|tara:strand:- start:263 stop:634 length:372 start_codon:yes stop_codon:yes gene_type:complete